MLLWILFSVLCYLLTSKYENEEKGLYLYACTVRWPIFSSIFNTLNYFEKSISVIMLDNIEKNHNNKKLIFRYTKKDCNYLCFVCFPSNNAGLLWHTMLLDIVIIKCMTLFILYVSLCHFASLISSEMSCCIGCDKSKPYNIVCAWLVSFGFKSILFRQMDELWLTCFVVTVQNSIDHDVDVAYIKLAC